MSWRSGVVAAGVGLAVLSVLGVSSEAHGAPPERSRAQQGTLVVDLNQATPQDLMQLPGIGRSRAEAIVKERNRRPYRRVSDIVRVPGIGRRTYLRLKPYLKVGPAPTAEHPTPRAGAPSAS